MEQALKAKPSNPVTRAIALLQRSEGSLRTKMLRLRWISDSFDQRTQWRRRCHSALHHL